MQGEKCLSTDLPGMQEGGCPGPLIEACRSAHFSILCDGGNDQDARKFFAIMVRFWDENARHAITQFLAIEPLLKPYLMFYLKN